VDKNHLYNETSIYIGERLSSTCASIDLIIDLVNQIDDPFFYSGILFYLMMIKNENLFEGQAGLGQNPQKNFLFLPCSTHTDLSLWLVEIGPALDIRSHFINWGLAGFKEFSIPQGT